MKNTKLYYLYKIVEKDTAVLLLVFDLVSVVSVCVAAAYKSEIVKSGVMKCREEPPKLLQGNKFQGAIFPN